MQSFCMTFITSQRKKDLESDLVAVLAQITAIDTAMTKATETAATVSYTFDSGTGKQQEVFRDPIKIFELRKSLVARRDLIRSQLNGTAITTMQLRR